MKKKNEYFNKLKNKVNKDYIIDEYNDLNYKASIKGYFLPGKENYEDEYYLKREDEKINYKDTKELNNLIEEKKEDLKSGIIEKGITEFSHLVDGITNPISEFFGNIGNTFIKYTIIGVLGIIILKKI